MNLRAIAGGGKAVGTGTADATDAPDTADTESGVAPDRTVRVATTAATGALLAAGALHVVWVFSPWPLKSWGDFAATLVGVDESQRPSGPETLAVAGVLGTAAGLVLTGSRPTSNRWAGSWPVRAGMWTVAGVLGARGLGGFAVSGLSLGDAPAVFRHWDLRLYSPICVTLGGLTGYVALRTRRRRRAA
ncbi:DUF3995 domain-containing protein [Streptomyces sp. LX-29]|uniref:DUF3995 domain-containing protein n=1 Tax=Streptomyces sp. LX-29 TaxID=2900152 RepID=UPI00240D3666|nr:DUF3995 domain-containing protein [Streptomyces sp. LX-29]WFB06074.1 DUF3995 domain-containing protein [Streptomyces sp. LX-29]